MAGVDLRTVAVGVLVQAAITLPPVLVVRALTADDVGASSYLPVVPAVLALLVAPAVAGAVAGRRQPATPLLHAAAAVGCAWLLLAVVTTVRLALGSGATARALTFVLCFLPIEVGLGVLGALFTRPRLAGPPEERLDLR